ncbi:MAG: protein TonB [Planctomycetota bacterium]|jgi:protein TonB
MQKLSFLLVILFSVTLSYSQKSNKDSEIFTVVESMPVFSKKCVLYSGDRQNQCTIKAIQNYSAGVDYPQKAINADAEGKVYIRFVVQKNGKVKDVRLLRSSGYEILDDVAFKHIKKMPKFAKPGYQRGKPVKVQYNIPIIFKLG